MVADNSDEGVSAAEGAPRRPPPTIDLDPSEISGDTAKPTKSARASLGNRWRRLRARIRPSLVRQKGVVAGTACVAVLILAAAWASGWMNTVGSPPESQVNQNAAVDNLTTRLSRLEAQVRTAPVADSSSSRVAAIETQVGNISTSVADIQRKVDATTAAIGELKSAPRGSVDLAPLNARLARLEQTAGASKGDTPEANTPLRRALAAQALDAAVRRGQTFVEVLAVAKRLTNDASALAPLDSFAASGVPNDAALGRSLLALLPQTAPRTSEQPAQAQGGSLVDRLMASASRLVHVQRVDGAGDQATGNSASVSGRIEAAIRSGNIAQARRELEALPDSERAATKPWMDSVARRDAAFDASSRFVASSLAALVDDSATASPPNTPAQ